MWRVHGRHRHKQGNSARVADAVWYCGLANFGRSCEPRGIRTEGYSMKPITRTNWLAAASIALSIAASYIRALTRSLPQIPLVAAGGLNQQNAEAFILAGATAIGVGTQLIPTESIERRQAKRVQELALRFSKFVKEARERVPVKKLPPASAARISAVHCDDK